GCKPPPAGGARPPGSGSAPAHGGTLESPGRERIGRPGPTGGTPARSALPRDRDGAAALSPRLRAPAPSSPCHPGSGRTPVERTRAPALHTRRRPRDPRQQPFRSTRLHSLSAPVSQKAVILDPGFAASSAAVD